ncbi:hypothetical protein VB773_15450 [Haloarculaceae archaeon H-GB2-1]|nr:hypothetical protein [Haloarculaceae archaeon H-GB1-1]MEA5387353.1 hypothetical protein [Haloarculaceae archaeon H-GB11]MEA5408822.1 hypothetical protein [Haloarculaceae archaeon H-GB2-1]
MSGGEEYEFVCPDCGESLAVNESMRDALIENGCVICGTPVSVDEFSVPEP